MTNRERVEALLRHEKPNGVPNWTSGMSFCTLFNGYSVADAYSKPEECIAAQRRVCRDFGWVFLPFMITSIDPAFCGKIKLTTSDFSQAPTVIKQPVETLEGAMNLKMPADVRTAGTKLLRTEFSRLSSREMLDNVPFNQGVFMGGPFTHAATIADIDNIGRWMLKSSEAVHHLIRLTVDYYLELERYWKETFGTEVRMMSQAVNDFGWNA